MEKFIPSESYDSPRNTYESREMVLQLTLDHKGHTTTKTISAFQTHFLFKLGIDNSRTSFVSFQ